VSLPATMRALRLHAPAADGHAAQLAVEPVERPDPGAVEVLVEVGACALGEEDRRIVRGEAPTEGRPRTLGRESAGTIRAVGAEVADWQPGDRVAVLPARACHRCRYCLAGRENLCLHRRTLGVDTDGGLAGYLVADPACLVPVPPGVAADQAALTTDTVASPYHALKRAGVGDGMALAVVGLGGLGLHTVQLARLAGATVVGVDPDPVARERALDWGAEEVVDPSHGDAARAVKLLTDGGVDRAIEVAGEPAAAEQAVRCLAPGGRAVLVGRSGGPPPALALDRLVDEELEVVGSSGATAQDLGELLDLLDDGRLDLGRSVTDRVSLDDAVAALTEPAPAEGRPVRTVVTDLP
jgi:D-arabinose 1-dehydrogenase-like Zn-dependent alcohol dehydrogenase